MALSAMRALGSTDVRDSMASTARRRVASSRRRTQSGRRRESLPARGFRVLRFWNGEVSEDPESVAQEIGRILRADKLGMPVQRHDVLQNPHLSAAKRPAAVCL